LPVYVTLPSIAVTFVVAHYYSEYELKQVIKLEEKRKELQGQLKDAEKLLVDKMDPQIYETIKKVVRRDLKHEIEAMKAD